MDLMLILLLVQTEISFSRIGSMSRAPTPHQFEDVYDLHSFHGRKISFKLY